MTTNSKTQIKKEDLTVMEELLHQANYQISDLEALCPADVFDLEVELEVYPPGEGYPYYFRVGYYLFSEILEQWYVENDIYSELRTGWFPRWDRDNLREGGPMYWYQNLATDKDQVEVTNYVIKQLFKSIF